MVYRSQYSAIQNDLWAEASTVHTVGSLKNAQVTATQQNISQNVTPFPIDPPANSKRTIDR